MKTIRNSIKAIIRKGTSILLIKNLDQEGFWYVFPGGGQEHGEDMHSALRRECLEETGLHVSVGPLRFVRDYIGKNHEFAVTDNHTHQVELYFECYLNTQDDPANGHLKDTQQVDVEWIESERLNSIRLYPKIFQQGLNSLKDVYLGDTN